jgi:type IV pilus assembly protein PilC
MRPVRTLKQPWLLGEYLIELAELLQSGASLHESLELLISGDSRDPIEKRLHQIITAMNGGNDFASAIESTFPKIPKFCTDLIRQSQGKPEFSSTLSKLGNYMLEMQAFNLKHVALGRALVYPAALIVVSLVIISILMIFVIPQYESLFDDFGMQLPALTQSVISLTGFLGNYGWPIASIIIMTVILWRYLFPLFPITRRVRGIMLLQLPVINNLFRLSVEGQLLSTLGLFGESKPTQITALQAAQQSFNASYAGDEINRICERVNSGYKLADTFAESRLFSHKLIKILRITERQGINEGLMLRQANRNKQMLNNGPNLNRVLEPTLMLILGLFIGYLVVAMYLPIFQLGALI